MLVWRLCDVIGPDEYQERVNKNSYTNRLAGFVLTEAVRILSQSREDEKLAEALGEADCEYWEKRFKEDTEKLCYNIRLLNDLRIRSNPIGATPIFLFI